MLDQITQGKIESPTLTKLINSKSGHIWFSGHGVAPDTTIQRSALNASIHPQDLPHVLLSLKAFTGNPSEDALLLSYRYKDSQGHYQMITENVVCLTPGERKFVSRFTAQQAAPAVKATATETPTQPLAQIAPMDRDTFLQTAQDHMCVPGLGVVVGIEHLSYLNASFGSAFGDLCLDHLGERLNLKMAGTAFVGRLRSNCFSLFFPHTAESALRDITQRIQDDILQNPVCKDGVKVPIVVGIGASFTSHTTCADELFAQAEHGLQQSKQQGRGMVVSFSEKTCSDARTFPELLAGADSFLTALHDNRITLAYQPVVNSDSSQPAFYECLVRMLGVDGRVVPAGAFMPAIEKMGLARLVDHFCLERAVSDLYESKDLNLSINVSAQTLYDSTWVSKITSLLARAPEVAHRLIIEISENAAMQDIENAKDVSKKLRNLGCRIALDDFGAGQTAFSHLHQLPIKILKIDRSFIYRSDEPQNRLFIRTLHQLAEGLGLETVAEGAETPHHVSLLRQEGINYIQGYIYGMPSLERQWLVKPELTTGYNIERMRRGA